MITHITSLCTKQNVSIAHLKTNSGRNNGLTCMTKNTRGSGSYNLFARVAQSVPETLRPRMRVIAMKLEHSPVGSRMTQINNCPGQYNPGCAHLQRVYRPAGRPHVHVCFNTDGRTVNLAHRMRERSFLSVLLQEKEEQFWKGER